MPFFIELFTYNMFVFSSNCEISTHTDLSPIEHTYRDNIPLRLEEAKNFLVHECYTVLRSLEEIG